ncbi:MAG: 16S rRNA (cytosine(1402)-N(4))-methyltransferase RsmH [Bacilli bacterium]|nr:16S rRNA (cytosine(1402)-N(4))-methyltransferase RsmH [Bacilli bacterium]MBQ8472098.1 16S rRNA (cytosine(1402)-N(4))-methyltransferase RsmH [Bacilli bacterium]
MSNYKHIPVLLNEALEALNINPEGIYVDCTLGGGGHSSEILKRLTTGKLICFDQDEYAISVASKRLSEISKQFTIVHSNFVNLKVCLEELGINKVDGILYDLGVSSFQLDIGERGFSYNSDAPLDMRMDQTASLSAWNVVNEYSQRDLTKIFYDYGEEKFSSNIAKKIVSARTGKTINTTFELVNIIKSALPAAVLRKSGHPAKKIFQAIRIEVNKELSVFQKSLEDAFKVLNVDGRIVVITFHSLEDRLCKRMFKEKSSVNLPSDMPIVPKEYLPEYELVFKKAVIPSDDELDYNNRAHSAKLRAIKRIEK